MGGGGVSPRFLLLPKNRKNDVTFQTGFGWTADAIAKFYKTSKGVLIFHQYRHGDQHGQ